MARLVRAVAGIISDGDRVLVTRRHRSAHLGGLLEFPGGQIDSGENPWQALQRELQEEVNITATSGFFLEEVSHLDSERQLRLEFWRVTNYSGVVAPAESQIHQWLMVYELSPKDFPPANASVIARIQNLLE